MVIVFLVLFSLPFFVDFFKLSNFLLASPADVSVVAASWIWWLNPLQTSHGDVWLPSHHRTHFEGRCCFVFLARRRQSGRKETGLIKLLRRTSNQLRALSQPPSVLFHTFPTIFNALCSFMSLNWTHPSSPQSSEGSPCCSVDAVSILVLQCRLLFFKRLKGFWNIELSLCIELAKQVFVFLLALRDNVVRRRMWI